MQLIIGRGRSAADIQSDKPLWVNNCGAYIDWGKNKCTLRPDGRSDWQMIFITGGRGIFTIDGEPVEMKTGGVVIYPPHVRQEYRFFSADTPSFWWVHFSGREVLWLMSGLLGEAGEGSAVHFTIDDTGQIHELLLRMHTELSRDDRACEEYLCGVLCEMVGICVKARERAHLREDADMERVCAYMKAHYAEHESLDKYAAVAGMSKYHFTRRFSEYTSMTPLEYITDIRVRTACDLLSGGELGVGECARLLGFGDQFYFCRVFKKHIGLSPSKYMKK